MCFMQKKKKIGQRGCKGKGKVTEERVGRGWGY